MDLIDSMIAHLDRLGDPASLDSIQRNAAAELNRLDDPDQRLSADLEPNSLAGLDYWHICYHIAERSEKIPPRLAPPWR